MSRAKLLDRQCVRSCCPKGHSFFKIRNVLSLEVSLESEEVAP